MSEKTWSDAVATLHSVLTNATSEQKRIIELLDIEISNDLPHLVVAAKLRDYLADVMAFPPPTEPQSRALSLIKFLKKDHDGNIEPQTNSEAEAWGHYLSLLRRAEHLERIKIETGDVVEIPTKNRFAEISSIGKNGRVYFKGGYGAGSWPDLLIVHAKVNDNSPDAKKMREKAQNFAAKAAPLGYWSETKHKELAEFEAKDYVNSSDINRLEQIIDAASDEKPIQKYLEENPYIITSLLGGKNRYCISQKRLGAEYVPDFLICDTDSLGISWVLIELETPNSDIYLKKDDQFDKYTRKGVAQVMEWREWLTSNIAYARNKRKENGLGLIDIRPSSPGIVIVGRRSNLRETKEIYRNQLRDKEDIHIHTYDWLLEQINGSLNFNGPPACNPYLLKFKTNENDDTWLR
jgi:Shedu protein SduA, C-terminal